MDTNYEILLEFYKSNERYMLHHESQRASMTRIILTIFAILIAVVSALPIGLEKIVLSLMLPVLGIFGYFFSKKHHERFSFHFECRDSYRKKLHEEFRNTTIDIKSIEQKLTEEYRWISEKRLNKFWAAIPLGMAIIGFIMFVISLLQYFTLQI